MRSKIPVIIGAAAAVALAAFVAVAQSGANPTPPAKPKYGKLHLWAEVGSFTLEGEGKVVLSFDGTLLLSNHSGPPPQITGSIRKEFDDMGRQVWFGSGKAVIEGRWRHLNWFGKKMDCVWIGSGDAMTFGEYDAKNQTGFAQIDDLPKMPWLTTGFTFYIPQERSPYRNAKPAPPRMERGDVG